MTGSGGVAGRSRGAVGLLDGLDWVRLLWSEAGAVCDLGFCA